MDIKKVGQISSKKGDKGSSTDYSSRSFLKSNILFEVLGTMDELSSNLGLAYHHTKYEYLLTIQKTLQTINSLIATDPNSEQYKRLKQIQIDSVVSMESLMQEILDRYPLEPRFALPGSEKSLNGAYMDICRTIARRAERRLTDLIIEQERNDLGIVQSYVNRLSDFLFVLSWNL